MESNVHHWIVQDAVTYIQLHGDAYQRQAVSGLNQLSGDNRPLDSIPPGCTKLGQIVGYAASDTDRFHDLIAGNWIANDYAQWDDNHVTAFNHFQNAYVVSPKLWDWDNGYHYWWSSRQDDDSRWGPGSSADMCGASVQAKSAALPHLLPFWRNVKSFQSNFLDPTELRDTVFAPVADLAEFYYNYALTSSPTPFGGGVPFFCIPLWVGGSNEFWGPKWDFLIGTALIGPVCHAIGDACVPQHFRPACGFYHGQWEGAVFTLAQNRNIDLNPPLVSAILSQYPFNPWWIWSGGPLSGCLPCAFLISQIAALGRDKLSASKNMSYTAVFNAQKNFWFDYLREGLTIPRPLPGGHTGTDANYYYNLAIAGVVHVLTRFYADLVNKHIYSPNPGLVYSERMPAYPEIPPAPFPQRKENPNEPDPVGIRPTPLSSARVLLGRIPLQEAPLQEALDALIRSNPRNMGNALTLVEEALVSEYRARRRVEGHLFNPLTTDPSVLDSYNISAHFGIGTFRPPSLEECTQPEGLSDYVRESEEYAYLTYLLRLTKHTALMEVASDGLEDGDLRRQILRQIEVSRHLKELALRQGTIVIPPYRGTSPEMPEVIQTRPDIPAGIRTL